MHPLNYRKEDLEKILNQNIEIKYKTYSKESEVVIGHLIRYSVTNIGDILPHTITVDLGKEKRTTNLFDIEYINVKNE